MNQRDRLGEHPIESTGTVPGACASESTANALGAIVTLIVAWLGARTRLGVARVL